MRTSYKETDVKLLLKDITGLVQPQSTQEREKMIQSGTHYCEMLPIEYVPTEKYMQVYDEALKEYANLYGPLTVDTAAHNCTERWRWINEPWPWQEGGC